MAGSCLACGKEFKNVKAHIDNCKGTLTCYLCEKRIPKSRIGRHIALHAGCYAQPAYTPPAVSVATLSCPGCQRRFTRASFYRKHVAGCKINMAAPPAAPTKIEIVDVDPDTIL